MKKLKLDIDAVRVESFATAERDEQRGTVQGHISIEASCYDTDCCSDVTDCCQSAYCSGHWTCGCPTGITCPGRNTCAESCHTGICYCA
jgi:hypothetical protein